MDNFIMYGFLIVLIACSAFFSAAETAISTLNRVRLQKHAKSGNKKAKRALFVFDNFDRALTTTLIGNNVVNIGSSAIATVLAIDMFGASGAAIATIVMTVLILVFGEVLPKCIARENSENFAIATSGTLHFLMTLTYPLAILLIKLKHLVLKFNKSSNKDIPSVTEQELKYIVENIEGEGVLEKQESELVRSSLEFDEKTVQEVLTPRVDMVAIDIEDDIEINKNIILKDRFSRIPVCRGDSDTIIGVLHTRDFLEAIIKNQPLDIEAMMQPPFFVYKSKKLSSLLADFKHNRMHLAVVSDDYGGTLGIVTMEDLLEQLVGDIWDEDEEIEHEYIKLNDSTYEISGDMIVRDLFEVLGLEFSDPEFKYSSMGGWAIEKLSHIPDIDETFEYENITFTINKMEDQRVKNMLVKINAQSKKA